MDYDIVIRNGSIVDGTGTPPFAGDVAVKDGRIAAVGAVAGGAAEEIDAAGRIVTPGFVDIHTHYDGQVTWEHRLRPSSGHGVTTTIMGNCGVGFAPIREHQRQLAIKLMEGVEDIPEVVMTKGIPWAWESFPDYLDFLDTRQADVDFAGYLPHSPLRVYVMGDRGANLEPPTQDDLAKMRKLTTEALKAGAMGVSTSRYLGHRFRSGELAPSVPTEADELSALAEGLADAGCGVFQMIPNSAAEAEAEFSLMERLVEVSGRPLTFSLLQNAARPANFGTYLELLAERGADKQISGQFYPRPVGLLFGLDLSYHPFSLCPSYRAIAGLTLAQKVERLRDPEFRRKLLSEAPEDPNPFFIQIVNSTDALFALGNPPDYHQSPDRTINARAAAMGINPRELILDELLRDEGHAILYAPSTIQIDDYLAHAREAFDTPGTLIGLGDGGAHYGMICDAAYPTYLLTQWAGEAGSASLGLAQAIRALTDVPARTIGLHDRGIVAPGYKADLNVIDIDRLELEMPKVSHDLPGGGKRLTQQATGYDATVLSGVVTYRRGEPTGALPGRLVRGARAAPAH
ncbi:amidohydrolase family protein [Sphingomonas sp. MG17]|uniref:Amidohydrolase family protein n=1 Tax=Sphingomonas tagetis TaxID=2949092 RepID=A0A9X2HSP5_9SPHN|nr:amidohydrolase family protein [Sphingomonas tagetis]